MRIVHDIDGNATVSAGTMPYSKAIGEDKASGFRVDLLITVTERGLVSEEAIYIERNARHILAALHEAVAQIEEAAKVMVDDGVLRPDWEVPER